MTKIKQKKLQIDNTLLENDFFEDVMLIGIVSALEYYQFIAALHQISNYYFVKNHESEIFIHNLYFPVFEYQESEKYLEHYFFCNRKKTKYMLEQTVKIDFIWMIKGGLYKQMVSEILPLLKKIKGMDFCFEIKSENLSMRHMLII